MIVRKASSDKINDIIIFYDKMCKMLGNSSFLPEGNKGGFPSGRLIADSINNDELFIGIEDDCIMAAYIINHLCDASYDNVKWQVDANKEEASILHALRISPDYSGRGYAKRLVEHAIQTAKQNKQKAIRLDCIKGNDVPQKMYLSYGFKHIDTVDIFYEDIGIERKFLLFELLL